MTGSNNSIGAVSVSSSGNATVQIYVSGNWNVLAGLTIIASANSVTSTYVADIYNSMGAKVAHQTVTTDSWTDDVSAYARGIYVMQVKDTSGNIIGQAKFIKVE